MLQFQPQKVVTLPLQRHFNPLLDKLQKHLCKNNWNVKLALNITEGSSSINNFNSSLVKQMPSQISYLDFYFHQSGTDATSKIGLSMTTIVKYHPSTTFRMGTILDSCSSLTVRNNNKTKTFINHYPYTLTKGN